MIIYITYINALNSQDSQMVFQKNLYIFPIEISNRPLIYFQQSFLHRSNYDKSFLLM